MLNYVNLAVPTMPLLVADKRGAAETKIIAAKANSVAPWLPLRHHNKEPKMICRGSLQVFGLAILIALTEGFILSARDQYRKTENLE